MQVKFSSMGCGFLSVALLYFVAVTATDIKTATEGDDVTLWKDLTLDNEMHVFLDDGSGAVLLNLDKGNPPFIRENVVCDMKTGSITLVKIQKKDSKLYRLQIDKNGNVTTFITRLNVTERSHPLTENLTLTPPPVNAQPTRNHIAAYVPMAVFAVLVLGVLAFCCKRRTDSAATSTQRSIGPSSCVNVTEDESSASSSRSGSVGEKEQEKLMEKK